ncbi:MAG: hypothetical protein WC341_10035 [Bacteroidales bacterium]|jgi:hypothetical protein
MKAKLVSIDLMVRVIVPDDATEEQINQAIMDKCQAVARDGYWFLENVTEVKDDTAVPFSPETDIELTPIRETGSSKEGSINIGFEELKGILGEPNVTDLDDPDKVKASWGFKDRNGRTAFVWAYRYDSPYDCLDWSCSGNTDLLRDLFGDLFDPR